MEISDEYFDAFIAQKIPLITNVCRIKGQMTRSGVRKWQTDGLVVVVDDLHFTMVATYFKKLVAASLHDRCMFEWGDWLNLVEYYNMKIEEEERKAYQEQCRETVNQLIKRMEN